MRLLYREENGELALETFQETTGIPEYAILSHRWLDDEPTFEDLQTGRIKTRSGYNKIDLCMQQANQDGIDFCWADTVCIDKSSSAELSEAINSMYKWYQHSEKCYAYLSDVAGPGLSTFDQSEWFRRGWTLQELVAPSTVEFFSAKWERLGDKASLQERINRPRR